MGQRGTKADVETLLPEARALAQALVLEAGMRPIVALRAVAGSCAILWTKRNGNAYCADHPGALLGDRVLMGYLGHRQRFAADEERPSLEEALGLPKQGQEPSVVEPPSDGAAADEETPTEG